MALGLSIFEMAQAVGHSPQSVSQWESFRTSPRPGNAIHLASAYGVSLNAFAVELVRHAIAVDERRRARGAA
jgi:transcriptional regulator with XRE-family HTH domain